LLEPSPESLKFCWLKVICCICQSNELEREIRHITGAADKNLGGPWPTQPSRALEPPLQASRLLRGLKN